jgi:Spy/CpxP family protein refolding chaperone
MQKPKKGEEKIMKKIALVSGMVFVSLLLISHGLYAQRFYRYGPGIEDDYYDLNLTREQMEKIDKLELELERELSPLISKLRSNYMELDELEAQGSYDPTKIKKIWDMINKLEDDIGNKEISHEKKIRDLLTKEQRIIFDSYYAYGLNHYGRGGFGRGYFGRGYREFPGGNYGYGRYGYGAGMGRNYLGRGAGRLGRSYYGYGRGIVRGFGMNRGYFGLGTGRLSGPGNYRNYPRFRYGRGPCGAGLGKWYRWDYGRGRWN